MLTLVLLLTPLTHAATLEVCPSCPYTSIQDALNHAGAGDTVEVSTGTWSEDLNIPLPVHLIAVDGPEHTTIAGQSALSTVSVAAAAMGTSLEGFTITPALDQRGVELLASATLREVVIAGPSGHYFSGQGGGVYAMGPELTLDTVSIEGMDATSGGGLFTAAHTEATDLVVHSCAASTGGGITVDTGGELLCTGCRLEGNRAYGAVLGWGGGLYAANAPVTLKSSFLTDNTAKVWGGHVAVGGSPSLTLTHNQLTGGEAEVSGGGLYALKVDRVSLSDNLWEDNAALGAGSSEGRGGHAVLFGCASTSLDRETLRRGSATSLGGALWVESGDLSVVDSTLEENHAANGGAVYFHGVTDQRSSLLIDHSALLDNAAELDGGALYVESNLLTDRVPDDVVVIDSLIQGNSAATGAGLMVLGARTLELRRSSLCANQADADGGALYLHDKGAGQEGHVLTNNLFVGNEASEYGADVYAYQQTLELKHSTFLGSWAGVNGAVYLSDSSGSFTSNLLAYTGGGSALHDIKGTMMVAYDAWFENERDVGGGFDPSGKPSLLFDANPLFYDPYADSRCEVPSFHPAAITYDGGDPDEEGLDLDGTPSDIGVHSGPEARPDLWADDDGDGYPVIYDCAPEDPSVHPYADEHCDERDEDCDGILDNQPVDPKTWYPDEDQDGFGDPSASPLVVCAPPEGWVADASDCDDTDPAIHPGADEVSDDGIDQDCDGADVLTSLRGGSCGCALGEATPAWLALLLIPLLLRRRTP